MNRKIRKIEMSRRMRMRLRVLQRVFRIGVIGLIGLSLYGELIIKSYSKEKEEETIITFKEVMGEVSAITPNFIAIVYRREEEKGVAYEIALPIDKEVRIVHKKNLKEIEVGDTVRVRFAEIRKKEEVEREGGKREERIRMVGRKAKEIIFVRPKRTPK